MGRKQFTDLSILYTGEPKLGDLYAVVGTPDSLTVIGKGNINSISSAGGIYAITVTIDGVLSISETFQNDFTLVVLASYQTSFVVTLISGNVAVEAEIMYTEFP